MSEIPERGGQLTPMKYDDSTLILHIIFITHSCEFQSYLWS